MLRVGLTGGIGSGKSSVVAMLREMGVPVVEADDLAHELSRAGEPVYDEIVKAFGREILAGNGEIDRARLAGMVFGSPEKLARLNGIVHPRVLERAERWVGERQREGARLVVIEAPLLVEAGFHRRLDRLVLVWCRPEQQIERLSAGRGMSREEAERRIAAQMPVEEKLRLADHVIDNSGSRDETRLQVEALVKKFEAEAATAGAGQGKEHGDGREE
jgi:dephospho-CoA kinase